LLNVNGILGTGIGAEFHQVRGCIRLNLGFSPVSAKDGGFFLGIAAGSVSLLISVFKYTEHNIHSLYGVSSKVKSAIGQVKTFIIQGKIRYSRIAKGHGKPVPIVEGRILYLVP
jgi:hypothetical protein